MKIALKTILEDTPVIAAVKNDKELEAALNTDIQVIFILYGDICTICGITDRIKKAGRIAMVHLDLITGLSAKDITLDYIKNVVKADGVITTRSNLVKHAKEIGLYIVVRYFVVDSLALNSIEKQSKDNWPDAIEILPGVMPKIITKVNKISRVPVITGGLISEKEDVMEALKAGAIAISATSRTVWEM